MLSRALRVLVLERILIKSRKTIKIKRNQREIKTMEDVR